MTKLTHQTRPTEVRRVSYSNALSFPPFFFFVYYIANFNERHPRVRLVPPKNSPQNHAREWQGKGRATIPVPSRRGFVPECSN